MSLPRTCVHCVLGRVLAAEAPALARAGVSVRVRPAAPVSLPRAAAGVYRELRRLLREAAAEAGRGIVRVTLVDLPGRYCLEVLATVADGGRARVLARAFPRHAEGTLEGGFLEGAPLSSLPRSA
jgi:hypothetical protein